MTAKEAIKLLKHLRNRMAQKAMPTYAESLALGIEALKRLKEHQEDHIDITYRALPGETKE